MKNYRPLKMLHGYAYPPDGTIDDKKKAIEQRLDDLNEKGYGGIVTNVDFDPNYLKDSDSWALFRHAISYASGKHGMTIWLYDEKGYPSGTAGGLTLKENADFECKALAMIKKSARAGDLVIIEKPRGHSDVISAYAIMNDSKYIDIIDLKKALSENGTLTYAAQSDCDIYYFITKRLYEGTHAQHNTCASRRYISLTDPKAIKAFINNTYKAYTDNLNGVDLPEGTIQAFFTDEPSFQACYINEGLNPSTIDDPYDTEMPLYPVCAWENGLDEMYYKKYNENIKDKLHYLFESDSKKAKETRFRFYNLLSDLYEEAFFKQLEQFCEKHNTAFSGHLLLEENILHHPLFEGNFFKLIRHMHIPGIDMLFTKPASIMKYAATPKLISSIAAWYNKPHVMSEISGHTENALKIPFDIHDIICAQLLQFILGVDIFNSYFDDSSLTLDENRLLCGTIANVCNEFAGKSSMANVLLYYPIESAQISVKGSAEQLYNRPYDSGAVRCEESWRAHIDELIRNHYMFDCISAEALEDAYISADEHVILNTLTNTRYNALVIPELSGITAGAVRLIIKIAMAGIPVIVNDMSDCIVLDSHSYGEDYDDKHGEEYNEEYNEEHNKESNRECNSESSDECNDGDVLIDRLLSCKNVIQVSSANECIDAIGSAAAPAAYVRAYINADGKDSEGEADIISDENCNAPERNIIMLAKKDYDRNKASYIALNISDMPLSADITLINNKVAGNSDTECGIKISDPISASPLVWNEVDTVTVGNGKMLHVCLPPEGAVLISEI